MESAFITGHIVEHSNTAFQIQAVALAWTRTQVQRLSSQHLNLYAKRSKTLDGVAECWVKAGTLPPSFGRACPHASLYQVPHMYTLLRWPQGRHPTSDTNLAISGDSDASSAVALSPSSISHNIHLSLSPALLMKLCGKLDISAFLNSRQGMNISAWRARLSQHTCDRICRDEKLDQHFILITSMCVTAPNPTSRSPHCQHTQRCEGKGWIFSIHTRWH
jgi:hypothetical protein